MFIVAILFSNRPNNLREFKGKHQVNKITFLQCEDKIWFSFPDYVKDFCNFTPTLFKFSDKNKSVRHDFYLKVVS